ncbi:MAG: glycyl-radical enzyme activating protein [Defluviitaleaceae bacterium]|nr:glycyl-radical enzyme activating protein [Defluviitaleaceae bacterium]
MSERGTVLRIEKTSIHDGDGLRTVVFLKGCPLKCKWCSTPESQCVDIEHSYGNIMTADEVIKEISKDEIFYFHSGGGITISGGEPLLQTDFTSKILQESKIRGINTAIETSMFGNFSDIKKLLPHLDTIYADIKHINSDIHKEFTASGNELILDNIKSVSEIFNGNIIIRVPLIPTFNLNIENAKGIAKFCNELNKISMIELLPYHRLGVDTYRKLGLGYDFFDVKTPSCQEVEEFANIITKSGFKVLF